MTLCDEVTAEVNDDEYDYYYDDGPKVEDFFIQKECDPNCVFDGVSLTAARLKDFPKSCITVCSLIGIFNGCDATEDELTAAFANMKHLIGSLSVSNVNYKSLKFLAGLETIETDNMGVNIALNPLMTEVGLTNLTTVTAPRLLIGSNPNMKTLNIPNLKNIAPSTVVNMVMNVGILKSPNLCITTEEIERFLEKTGPGNTTIVVKYCDPIPGGNVCTSPQYGCTRIFGEILVGREPEWKLEMFKTVEYIFGNLQIYEANLTSFDFLPSLKYIANQDKKKSALYINGNMELKNFTFPSLKKILSGSDFTVVVSNSSEELLMNPAVCIGFAKLETEPSKWGPMIDGHTCDQIKETARNLTGWVEDQGNLGLVGWKANLMLIIVVSLFLMMVDYS
ncbi:unnamed protein product [Caenorhabditis brenneri]